MSDRHPLLRVWDAFDSFRMIFLTAFLTIAWLVAAHGWVRLIAVVFPALWIPAFVRWRKRRAAH